MFSSTDQKTATKAAASQSASDSPSRNSIGDSAASAQHWSPLGHGASAFSGAQAALGHDEADATSVQQDEGGIIPVGQSGARSPLRALSSNSPTRMRPAQSGSLSDAVHSKHRPPSPDALIPASDRDQAFGFGDRDHEDSSEPTLILSSVASAGRTQLPANALVAYSSDEDDWHNAEDATESRIPLATAGLMFWQPCLPSASDLCKRSYVTESGSSLPLCICSCFAFTRRTYACLEHTF